MAGKTKKALQEELCEMADKLESANQVKENFRRERDRYHEEWIKAETDNNILIRKTGELVLELEKKVIV